MRHQFKSLLAKTYYCSCLVLVSFLLYECSPIRSLCTPKMDSSKCGCDPVAKRSQLVLIANNIVADKEFCAGLKDISASVKIKDAESFSASISGYFSKITKRDTASRNAVLSFLEGLPSIAEEHNSWVECDKTTRIQSQKPQTPREVILMDSYAKNCVYCQNTFNINGSNSDDILRLISDLGVLPYTIPTNLQWQDEQRVINLSRKIYTETNKPAIIIIHASAFYEETKEFEANKKLLLFLKSLKDEKVKILVYSRGLEADAPQDTQKRWDNVVGEVKELKGKAYLYVMAKGHNSCFDDPEVGIPFKKEIRRILTED